MQLSKTDELQQLALTTRNVLGAAARLDPVPPTWEGRDAGLNWDLWRSLAELGLLGVGVAEERGGSGGGMRELCVIAEEVGSALLRVPFSGTAAVLAVTGMDASDLAVEAPVVVPAWETFPDALVPQSRSDALRLVGDTVDGSLIAVPFGMDAGQLLAFAGPVPVLVDLNAPGVHRHPVETFDITEPAAAIELTSVPATVFEPVANLDRIRVVLAAELVGTGQRALDGAVEFARQRHQFGRAIGSFQAIKHLLADRHVQMDGARLLVEWAAAEIDNERPGAAMAALTALAAAADAVHGATRDALQVHGGIGFTWEHASHVYLKRARARRSLFGSADFQFESLAGLALSGTPTN